MLISTKLFSGCAIPNTNSKRSWERAWRKEELGWIKGASMPWFLRANLDK